MSIRLKFILAVFGCLTIVMAVGAFHLNNLQSKVLEQEARNRSEMVVNFSHASRQYVKKKLRPTVRKYTDDMIFEAMSSTFATRNIIELFNEQMPEYIYKQATTNPLNPINQANPFEQQLIEKFQSDSKTEELTGYTTVSNEERFYLARPIKVEESCLKCHGNPETAPKAIVERYGKTNGYWWRVGDIISALMIYVPTQDLRANFASMLQTLWGTFAALTVTVIALIYLLFGKLVGRRLQRVAKVMSRTSANPTSKAEIIDHSTDEIGIVARAFNRMSKSLHELLQKQAAETRWTELLAEIARARSSGELESALNNLLSEVLSTMSTSRVVIYRLYPDGRGYIAAEAVLTGWPSALGDKIEDPCIGSKLLSAYKKGRVVATRNVSEADFHPEHLQLMERLQIKSNLVAPIVQGEELYGLLIAHHCDQTHDWQKFEIDYLVQIANQLGLALSGFSLLEKKQAEAERQREQKEALQGELSQLLTDVEGVSSGNLTVRAEINAGEIGIVADFFNSIIESLREIVSQVKQAASQVNISVGENEGEIRLLADEAIKQATQISQTLNSVEEMTRSIQEVADNARAAAEVARTASSRAQTGGAAMERTVESILQLRETVAETAKKVKRLGESSQQISQVISLINQIALKTNLLAVNASIEAARAGKEGRGFAVVAEEVSELAEQSAAATKEIQQIVASIQLGTSEVVQAMEVGTAQVVEGTSLVEETKQSLEQIVEVSRQIDQLLQSISSATVSQVETSQMVRKLMEEIAQVSERTSDSSGKVSSSLKQTVAIAQQLQASVGMFKVDPKLEKLSESAN
ncbi:MAG: DUF3365 domain-containing protein [Xenococcaceae cyanobacterium]